MIVITFNSIFNLIRVIHGDFDDDDDDDDDFEDYFDNCLFI